MKKGQLRTGDQSVRTAVQHTKPCPDCPWTRTALKGWLGSMTVEEWLAHAHADSVTKCHCFKNQQCAGLAIYRRNVAKLPLPPNLILDKDKVLVFASRKEFTDHHQIGPQHE